MRRLLDLFTLIGGQAAEWRSLRIADLQFWHRTDARIVLTTLVALALILLVGRTLARRGSPHGVMLPALLASIPRSRGAFVIHLPLLLFVLGLPFFMLAYADPFTPLVLSETSLPGRRIAIMIDASGSMKKAFTTKNLNTSGNDAAFFSVVAAAQQFVRLRIDGKYHDLIGLIEFGTTAYVVMPFTNDYENALLSISLVGDAVEFDAFPDRGTIIPQALDESIELYRAFDFLDASGNLMVIFTDGEDANTKGQTRSLDDILQRARDARIPVYFVRTNYALPEGGIMAYSDDVWKSAVAKTGGRFYVASDEASLLRAIHDINRLATGTIQLKMYSQQRPRFGVFTLIAWGLWTTAAALKLGVPHLRKL